MRRLKNATAIVTGASRGIGPFICESLGSRGVNLALVARSEAELRSQARRLQRHGIVAAPVPADLATASGVDVAVAGAARALGSVDILVNNAGLECLGSFHEIQPAALRAILRLNMEGTMQLTRLVLPSMLARGRGHIVTIASAAGAFGVPYQAVYASTKAALVTFMSSIRSEYRGTGVSASAVLPTLVVGAGMYERERLLAPAGERISWALTCRPREVARAVVRAIEQDRAEVTVNRFPLRPVLGLLALFPGAGGWLLRQMGVTDSFSRAADRRRCADTADTPRT
jgi:short-subunit dehydrogenase